MRVTATHLTQWSDQRVAQEILPVLVRRLISATSHVTALSMPGGDSVVTPGWDGIVRVNKGNAWVPDGLSYWELGTSQNPLTKARTDFKKRVAELPAEERMRSAFVFVTSRRWRKKADWQAEARAQKAWADVQVWDADDLEAWLESSAATSLWLGAQLGIAGYGVDSVEKYWEHWCNQSKPAMTAAALFTGREKSKDELQKHIQQREPLIAVTADSQSEAVAFVCAFLIEAGYSQQAACVTSEEGWHFIDANTGIKLVIVAGQQLANHRAAYKGVSLIIPLAVGDQPFNLIGTAATATEEQNIIELIRPKPDEFEKAVSELGLVASDASRYSRTMGRSWTVFRRWQAVNPAIKKPVWVDGKNIAVLQMLTLVGSWDGKSGSDRACIEQIANRPYEEIENELLELALLDDSPVLKIGSLWKAKAPLELLHLMAPRLNGAILSRFFQVAKAVFEEPDSVLELEEGKRWMVSVYGKVRKQSGALLDAMADSIAKLGSFADNNVNAMGIAHSVRDFVQQLLENADKERWLSVSSYLRSFAEAAPDEFLAAIQQSLQCSEKSIICLLQETSSSGSTGRCWHAELLWALEILAWYPRRLKQVANILAQLSDTPIKGNWANTPLSSLVSLFRPWYPQTAAPVNLRLQTVNDVVNQYPHIGWKLLLALVPKQLSMMVMLNATPKWRDDDAGSKNGATYEEYYQFVQATAVMLVEKAKGNADRIAELIPVIVDLDAEFRDAVIELVRSAQAYNDENKELIRVALREFLCWQNSFNRDGQRDDRYAADALRPVLDTLIVGDLVIRHAWIFANGRIHLPDGRAEDYKETERITAELRALAVREVFNELGWQGIDRLANRCQEPRLVGWELVKEPFERKELIHWLCQRYLNVQQTSYDSLTFGVMQAISPKEHIDFFSSCVDKLYQLSAAPTAVAEFMSNASQTMPLWQLIEEQPQDVAEHFWRIVRMPYFHTANDELIFCINKLLAAKRPKAALEAIGDCAAKLSGRLLMQTLRDIATGPEEDGPLPQYWHISRVFKALSDTGEYSQSEMARLEFAYYEALQHDKYGTPNLMAEIWRSPESFMELLCLAFKPRHSERELIPDNMRAAVQTAGSLIHNGHGVPGKSPDGSIDKNLFFSWINKTRELANEKDRSAVTDLTIGTWLSDWPCNKTMKCWPDPIIAELLDQEDCEDIRRGFYTGVHNARGVSSRMPYDGGEQEREIANMFRDFAEQWANSKPNLVSMIENIAKSYEYEAYRQDEDGLWSQES